MRRAVSDFPVSSSSAPSVGFFKAFRLDGGLESGLGGDSIISMLFALLLPRFGSSGVDGTAASLAFLDCARGFFDWIGASSCSALCALFVALVSLGAGVCARVGTGLGSDLGLGCLTGRGVWDLPRIAATCFTTGS